MARLTAQSATKLAILLAAIALDAIQPAVGHHRHLHCPVWKKNCQRYDVECKHEHEKREWRSCCDVAQYSGSGNGLDSETQISTLPSGVYSITSLHGPFTTSKVFCDTTTDRGGWTVVLRRISNETNFNRTWQEYEDGFGDLTSNFWYGLKPLRSLTNSRQWELRVDLYDRRNDSTSTYYALYSSFKVQGCKYTLQLQYQSGTAEDNLRDYNGRPFMAPGPEENNCANNKKAGWWYTNAESCGGEGAILTSNYGSHLMYWYFSTVQALNGLVFFPKVEMKIRPTNCLF